MVTRQVLISVALSVLLGGALAPAHAQAEDADLLAPLAPKQKTRSKKRSRAKEPASTGSAAASASQLALRLPQSLNGARLFLDDTDLGTVPPGESMRQAAPGTHQLTLKRQGYRPFTQTVVVPEGGTTRVPVVLEAVAGVLSLQADAPGAQVTIDGKAVGTAPLSGLIIEPGTHDIQVRLDGREPYASTLTVMAGEDYSVRAQLRASPSAQAVGQTDRPERLRPPAALEPPKPAPMSLPPASAVATAPGSPWYSQWYVWAGAGAVAAATVGTILVVHQNRSLSPNDVCGGPCDAVLNRPAATLRF